MNVIAALLIATHGVGPYDWHMSCERWQQRAQEILVDEALPINERWFLIRYLRNKVEGECSFDWTNNV
jgi:hypothetical protein